LLTRFLFAIHRLHRKRRAYKEAQEEKALPQPAVAQVDKKKFIKIGKPGYRITKRRDPVTQQNCMFFEVNYPEIVDGVTPKYRFMSAYEQKIEDQDSKFQYVLFAAEPYATIAFKIENRGIDTSKEKIWKYYNEDTKTFYLQFHFKADRTETNTRPTRQGFQPAANPLNPFAPQAGMPPLPPPPPGMGMGMMGGPPPMGMGMGHQSINQGLMGMPPGGGRR
jgi:splicing factor 3A subunit 2